MIRYANAEDTQEEAASLIDAYAAQMVARTAERVGWPLLAWQRDRVAASVRVHSGSDARAIARAFGLDLLDIDPALRRAARRDHVAYRRRQLARRRRSRR